MGRDTVTTTKKVEQEKTVTETETQKREEEYVTCDDCSEFIGPVEEADPNIALVNPSVDMVEFRDSLKKTFITRLKSRRGGVIRPELKESEVIEFINNQAKPFDNKNDELVGEITVECDEIKDVCDECGVYYGISINDSQRGYLKPELRNPPEETESTETESTAQQPCRVEKSFIWGPILVLAIGISWLMFFNPTVSIGTAMMVYGLSKISKEV